MSSSSSSSDNLFLLRKEQQAERLLLQSESTPSNSSQTLSTAQQEAGAEVEAESCENRAESKEQKKFKLKPEEKQEEEDDGFRTPTSLDHRIPEAKQCPATPRKPKPTLKRKANSSQTSFTPSSCRRNPLDLSVEVELLLFQTQHNPLSDSHQNPKKSRRHECK